MIYFHSNFEFFSIIGRVLLQFIRVDFEVTVLNMFSDQVTASNEEPASLETICFEPSCCPLCKDEMKEGEDCLIINECTHAFHRHCIENRLLTTSECPVCHRSCQLNELRKYVIIPKNVPPCKPNSTKYKGRGAMAKHYQTRSTSRNLIPLSENAVITENILLTPNRNAALNSPAKSKNDTSNANSNTIDYNAIGQFIDEKLNKFFETINLLPQTSQNNANHVRSSVDPNHTAYSSNNKLRAQPPTANPSSQAFFLSPSGVSEHIPKVRQPRSQPNRQLDNSNNIPPSQPQPVNPTSPSFNLSLPSLFNSNSSRNLSTDKITSIIQNWNLKFDGSSTGLNVEEFLYRVRSLTKDNFNSDFSVVCSNLNIMLTGKAQNWFWRYHKQVQAIVWDDFCDALRSQFREFKSYFEIREEVRNRKQKQNETFDAFFDSISEIMDRLPSPMSENDLMGVLARNLRPEIRQDLLYVPIRSLSHLRKLVQMRENFLTEEHVRRNLTMRNANANTMPRRYISEVDIPEDDHIPAPSETELFIEAIDKPDHDKCWNCGENGHHWQDCLHDRLIFCYGCGAKNVFKPKCVKCTARTQNPSKNLRGPGPQRDQA